jgi:hypothetical protein
MLFSITYLTIVRETFQGSNMIFQHLSMLYEAISRKNLRVKKGESSKFEFSTTKNKEQSPNEYETHRCNTEQNAWNEQVAQGFFSPYCSSFSFHAGKT